MFPEEAMIPEIDEIVVTKGLALNKESIEDAFADF